MKSCFKLSLVGLLLEGMLYCGNLWATQPDLVLMITVDQLRGDFARRIEDRLAPNGFRYLLEHGTVYLNAHYTHLLTSTAAGHATLMTGANTPQHGMAGNDWFDLSTRRAMYNTEDRDHPILGESELPGEGRSPRNLLSPTIADQLVAANDGKSRIFSASLKDRGAIIPAGQSGKAFWYSKTTGKFVTSSYYYPEYPEWVVRWNNAGHADQYRDQNWELLLDRDRYVFHDQDDRWFEKPEGLLGRTFPHPLGNPDSKAFYSSLRSTPMADQLLLSFVKEWIEAENIGSEGQTDLLAVSFSATDYIGHDFGPNSLEAEDNLLRLDRTLQELFRFLDQRVGLDRTLVVLASDHGVAPAPERMARLGTEAQRHHPVQFMQRANTFLRTRFGIGSDLAIAFFKPGVYLDTREMRALGLDPVEVERALAAKFMQMPGFTAAYSRSDLLAGILPDTERVNMAAHSIHPYRSGHVILVQDPFWYLGSEPDDNTATHGSPYAYDTHIPIMMAGPGINQRRVFAPVEARDLARTVCKYLGIAPLSDATGQLLPDLVSAETD
jgi:predicted AlkP superfamily pyrophosphatase or phosphodiesterase